MDTMRFETLAAASDALKQENDLIEEVVNPYKSMLSKIACRGAASKTGRVPHAVMLVNHPEAYQIIATSRLQQSAVEDVLEWVQREIWIIVERNYGHVMVLLSQHPEVSCSYSYEYRSFHGAPKQPLQEPSTPLVQRQALIWANLRLGAVDVFIMLSHALIYFDSLTCCIACATEVAGGHHKADDKMQINPEKINMLWVACVHLAVLALTHWEAPEGPHIYAGHNMWEAL